MVYPFSSFSPLTRSLTALALCAAPLLVQAQANCASPNTDADYILGDIGGDGTAMHWATGLVWKRCLEGQSFDDITNQCAGGGTKKDWKVWAETDGLLPQSFTGQDTLGITAGFTQNLLQSGAWRMAYKSELQTITENCSAAPKLNHVVFPNDPSSSVASGSPHASNPLWVWYVRFGTGDPAYSWRGDGRVRLVRAGQSFTNLISPAAQTVVANAQASFAPITLAPSTGTGQAWGGVRIIGAGNPQFQVNGSGVWLKEAIVKSTDTLTVRLTAPAAGSRTATLELRSGQTTGTSLGTTNPGDETTAMQKTTASFTLTALGGAQPIPTLGEWAVLLLTGLLGLLGVGALRRRNNNHA